MNNNNTTTAEARQARKKKKLVGKRCDTVAKGLFLDGFVPGALRLLTVIGHC